MDPQLRNFEEPDFPKLEELWRQTGVGGAVRRDDLACIRRTIERGGRLIVGEHLSDIIASSWLSYDGRRLHLHHMAVHPSFRRRGLACKMMMEAVVEARRLGTQLKLEVASDNEPALSLFRKFRLERLDPFQIMILRS